MEAEGSPQSYSENAGTQSEQGERGQEALHNRNENMAGCRSATCIEKLVQDENAKLTEMS